MLNLLRTWKNYLKKNQMQSISCQKIISKYNKHNFNRNKNKSK